LDFGKEIFMITVPVTIVGVSPLLQHRFGDVAQQSGTTRAAKKSYGTPREEAEAVAYVSPTDGTHYFSAAAITRAMAQAGSNHKMKGTRKSLRFVVPSAVRVNSETITILDDGGKAVTRCEVDSRPVTIPATKGRIMRHRPRYEKWSASFDLAVNDNVIDIDTVHMLLNEAGNTVGIGDFRPEKTGPFGQFRVTSFGGKAKK